MVEEEEEEEGGMGGQRTSVGLPPWTSVPDIISSCEEPSYFAIVPNLEVTSISVHSVLPLILICFFIQNNRNNNIGGKRQAGSEKIPKGKVCLSKLFDT